MSSASPIFLPLLLLLLLLSSTPRIAGDDCGADKTTLYAIKASFLIPDILSSWNETTSCCNWPGVTCSDNLARVISLRISGSGTLSGNIPEAISDLTFLGSLALSDLPHLTGGIPQFPSRLPLLSSLVLNNNSLSGPIPSYLSQITSLRHLDLSHNSFSGSIPGELSLLRELIALQLSNNQLTGGVPPSFASLDILFLYLSENQFDGDASALFGADKKTLRMNLSWNRFRFDIGGVRFPVRLLALDLSHNEINGLIPAQINEVSRLMGLDLSYNKLSGVIPAGPVTGKFGRVSYDGNALLCGAPLIGPCPRTG